MSDNPFSGRPDLPKLEVQLPEAPESAIRWAIIIVLALMAGWTSFFTVGPEEKAVVLRFGQYSQARVFGPGLHLKIPFGIDQVIKVPVQRQMKQEFGFRTVGTGGDARSEKRAFPAEAKMLTGDLNAAVVEWVVQYRIDDPELYLFRVRNVEETFRDMSEAVMREVVGDRTVNEVLTVGRTEIEHLVMVKLQELNRLYLTGIVVDQVVLMNVTPPEAVRPSFNEVNEAEQERERSIRLAEKELNEAVPKARGEAQQIVQEAQGYALERVNRARGEGARFDALYEAYREAPEVTRRRLYLETVGEVLPKAGHKVVVDSDSATVVPLLGLEGLGSLSSSPNSSQRQGGSN
ncbi:MAG: FtsH protease activity modulator HflK [Acidobacteriota bacterium]